MALQTNLDYTWRFLLTTLDSVTLAFLDGIATSRTLTRTLNKPSRAEGQVRSADSRVNIVHTDTDPYLSMNSRLLYGFRHEPGAKWVCRFGGILHQPDDEAETEDATTHFVAYDPWQRLMSVPVVRDDGALPTNGLYYSNKRGSAIALELLQNADAAFGFPHGLHIDYGQFGGSSTADVANTDFIAMHFDQGTSLGDAWGQLVEQGFDIYLDPVYDPVNRPGIVAALKIRQTLGSQRNDAVFGWDKAPRSTVAISRLKDGTKMANKVIPFASQGIAGAPQTNAGSVSKYGQYVEQMTISGQPVPEAVTLIAQGDLVAKKNGGLTLTVDPMPDRAGVPFVDYDVGDVVPVYASSELRYPITHLQRVYEIPLDIADDGRETVRRLLVSDPSL